MGRYYVAALNERDQEVSFLTLEPTTAVVGGVIQLHDRTLFQRFHMGQHFYLEVALTPEDVSA